MKTTAKKNIKTRKFNDYLSEKLKNAEYARGFIEASLQEYVEFRDKEAFLGSIKHVAEVHGGIQSLSRKIGVSRSALYKIFSEKGNPTLDTLYSILEALGFTIKIAIGSKKLLRKRISK